MRFKTRSIVLPLGLLALGALAPGMAAAETIYGCLNKTNGNTRIVAEGVPCRNSELPVSWNTEGPQGPAGPQGPVGPQGPAGPAGPAGSGVKAIAAIVNADGTANGVTPNGYTVVRTAPGLYRVSFPPGTWTAFPVMTVTAFGVFGAVGVPVVLSAVGFGDGSASFEIGMYRASDQVAFDNAFMFTAAQSLSPAP